MRALRMLASVFFMVAALGNVKMGDPIGMTACVAIAALIWPARSTGERLGDAGEGR